MAAGSSKRRFWILNDVVIVVLIMVFMELNHTLAPIVEKHCFETVTFWLLDVTVRLPVIYDVFIYVCYFLMVALYIAGQYMEVAD